MRKKHRSAAEVDAIVQLCQQHCDALSIYENPAIPVMRQGTRYGTHRLFDVRGMAALRDRLDSLSSESKARLEDYIRILDQRGAYRRLAMAPPPAAMTLLRDRFPHFSPVIDLIEGYLALSQVPEQGTLELPNIMLGGDPGIGKTYFGRHLSAALGTNYSEISLGSTTGGFVLGGLDLGWSTGQSGKVYETLVRGQMGNPMILLDELDKANSGGNSNVIGPLYGLLEHSTARTFTDEAVQLPIDASKILWIATANSLDLIPEPIVSRFTTFVVPLPTAEQGAQIAKHVYTDLRLEHVWGRVFPDSLEEGVLEIIATAPPRAMRKLLASAAGNAALAGRHHIRTQDLRIETRRTMGFI